MGKPNIEKYWASMTPDEKLLARKRINEKASETKKKRAAERERALVESKGHVAASGLSIPEVDRPPQEAIEKVVELSGKRVGLAAIRKVFAGISDKAWENLKTYAFKEGVATPNDAGIRIQKNAENHAKVLRKRIKDLKDRLAAHDNSKRLLFNPQAILLMLHKAEDDLYEVETKAIEKSYRVGAFGNKKGKSGGGIILKLNIPRPPEIVIEKDITPDD